MGWTFNMYNAVLTLLVLKKICTFEEAEAIAEKLNNGVVPAKFKDAYQDLEYLLGDILEKKKK